LACVQEFFPPLQKNTTLRGRVAEGVSAMPHLIMPFQDVDGARAGGGSLKPIHEALWRIGGPLKRGDRRPLSGRWQSFREYCRRDTSASCL
jgi:hypothetical protein